MTEYAPQPGEKPRKLGRGAIIIVATLALLTTSFVLMTPREPHYKGKSLSSWLEDINRAGNLAGTAPATEAIRIFGTNAIPYLARYIVRPDPIWKKRVIDLLIPLPVIGNRIRDHDALVAPSFFALKILGTNALPIIPQLLDRVDVNNRYSRYRCLTAVHAIGIPMVPVFELFCASRDFNLRVDAAFELSIPPMSIRHDWTWQTDPNGRGRISYYPNGLISAARLADHMSHTNSFVRQASAEAARRLEKRDELVLKALHGATEDSEMNVRDAAKQTLEILTPNITTERKIR